MRKSLRSGRGRSDSFCSTSSCDGGLASDTDDNGSLRSLCGPSTPVAGPTPFSPPTSPVTVGSRTSQHLLAVESPNFSVASNASSCGSYSQGFATFRGGPMMDTPGAVEKIEEEVTQDLMDETGDTNVSSDGSGVGPFMPSLPTTDEADGDGDGGSGRFLRPMFPDIVSGRPEDEDEGEDEGGMFFDDPNDDGGDDLLDDEDEFQGARPSTGIFPDLLNTYESDIDAVDDFYVDEDITGVFVTDDDQTTDTFGSRILDGPLGEAPASGSHGSTERGGEGGGRKGGAKKVGSPASFNATEATVDLSAVSGQGGEGDLDPTAMDSDESTAGEEGRGQPGSHHQDAAAEISLDLSSASEEAMVVADVGIEAAPALLSAGGGVPGGGPPPSPEAGGGGDGRHDSQENGHEYLPNALSTPPIVVRKDIAWSEDCGERPERPASRSCRKSRNRENESFDERTAYSHQETVASEKTLPRSNLALALVDPIDNRESGMGRGDVFVTILNLPKKDRRHFTAEKGQPLDEDVVRWGAHSVKDAIWRMRKLHAKIEGEAYMDLPVPTSIETAEEVDRGDGRSRPVDAAKHGRKLQKQAAEALRKDDMKQALMLYEKIYSSYRAALERQQKHGPKNEEDLQNHPSLGAALYNIGIVHLLNSSFEDAADAFEQSRNIRAKSVGLYSDEYNATLAKQGLALYGAGRLLDAQALLDEAIADGNEYNPDQAELMNTMGCIQYATGHREAAMTSFQCSLELSAVSLSESLYGGSSMSQLIMTRISSIRANIGQLFLKLRAYEEATDEFEGALMNQFLLFKPSDPFVLATRDKLAFANVKRGESAKALQMYQLMLEAQIDSLGRSHVDCSLTLKKISLVHIEEKNQQKNKTANRVMGAKVEMRSESYGGGGGEVVAAKIANMKLTGRFRKLTTAIKSGKKRGFP